MASPVDDIGHSHQHQSPSESTAEPAFLEAQKWIEVSYCRYQTLWSLDLCLEADALCHGDATLVCYSDRPVCPLSSSVNRFTAIGLCVLYHPL